jgi:hypothetical protein
MPPRKKSTGPSTPVQSIKHKDTRPNIPTEELRDFVVEQKGAAANAELILRRFQAPVFPDQLNCPQRT